MPRHNMPYCDESTNPSNGWRSPGSFAGFHKWPAFPNQPDGPTTVFGSFEVFWVPECDGAASTKSDHVFQGKGWYWWPCQPGCLPDTDDEPSGPFATAEGAYLDAIGD